MQPRIAFLAILHTGKIVQKKVAQATLLHNKQIDSIPASERSQYEKYRFAPPFEIDGTKLKYNGQGLRILFRAHLWLLANNLNCTGIVSVNDWNLSHSGKNIVIVGALNELYKLHNSFLDASAYARFQPKHLADLSPSEFENLKNFAGANEILIRAAANFKTFAENFLKVIGEEPTIQKLLGVLQSDPEANTLQLIQALLKEEATDEKLPSELKLPNLKLKLTQENIIPAELDSIPLRINSIDVEPSKLTTSIPIVPVNMYTHGTGALVSTLLRGQNSIASYIGSGATVDTLPFYQMFFEQMTTLVCNEIDVSVGNFKNSLPKSSSLSPASSINRSPSISSTSTSTGTTTPSGLRLMSMTPSDNGKNYDCSPTSHFSFGGNSRLTSENSGITLNPSVKPRSASSTGDQLLPKTIELKSPHPIGFGELVLPSSMPLKRAESVVLSEEALPIDDGKDDDQADLESKPILLPSHFIQALPMSQSRLPSPMPLRTTWIGLFDISERNSQSHSPIAPASGRRNSTTESPFTPLRRLMTPLTPNNSPAKDGDLDNVKPMSYPAVTSKPQ